MFANRTIRHSTRRPASRARRLAAPLAVGVAIVLGACESERLTEVRPPKQPEVRSVDYVHSVAFPGGLTQLSVGESQRLAAFLAGIGAAAPDEAAMAPWPPEAAGMPPSPAVAARSRAVAAVLLGSGIEPVVVAPAGHAGAAGTIPPVDAGGPVGPRIDVAVRRYLVMLPDCPDWSDRPGWNFSNQPTSNWGCATAINLGMMVANPKDLIRGRGPGYGMAEPLAQSIVRYREDKVKELQAVETTQVFGATEGGQ